MPKLEDLLDLKLEVNKLTSQRETLEREVEALQQRQQREERALTSRLRQQQETATETLSTQRHALDRRQRDLDQREADLVTREAAVSWVNEQQEALKQQELALQQREHALTSALAEAHGRAQAWQERQKELDVKATELARREGLLPPENKPKRTKAKAD